MADLLTVHGLTARYGSLAVLHDIDLTVREGEIVALLGSNGAGKTTLLRSVSRIVTSTGVVRFDGTSIAEWSGARAARAGIGHVPEGRGTFVDLTVEENLRMGSIARPKAARPSARGDLELVYATFPVLEEMRRRTAGLLSGGQQQMLAIARALMARPRLLLIDEPSLGLAPMLTQQLFQMLTRIRDEWAVALLIAEQNARLSVDIADRVVVLAGGRVAAVGAASEFRDGEAIRRAYLGHAQTAAQGGEGI